MTYVYSLIRKEGLIYVTFLLNYFENKLHDTLLKQTYHETKVVENKLNDYQT